MKKILSAAILSLLSISLFAQFEKIDVEFGEKFNYFSKTTTEEGLFANNNDEVTAITNFGSSSYSQVAFTHNLIMNKVTNAEKELFGISFTILDYKILRGRLYCFVQGKENKATVLKACEIDMKTGGWKGEPKTLISSDQELYSLCASANSGSDINPFSYNYSMDRTKLIVHYRYKNLNTVDGKKYAKMCFAIFDSSMTKIASKEAIGTLPDANLARLSVSCDSKFRLYIYNEMLGNRKDGVKYQIHTIEPNADKFSIAEFNTGDPQCFMKKILMQENTAGDIVFAGLTTDEWHGTKKVLSYKLSTDKNAPVKILDQSWNGMDINRKYQMIDHISNSFYSPYRLKLNPDGSIFLLYAMSFKHLAAYSMEGTIINGEGGFCYAKIDTNGDVVRNEYISRFLTEYVVNHCMIDGDDIYFLSIPDFGTGAVSLNLNKLHNGKLESKVLIKDISGIGTVATIDDHNLVVEVLYKYNDKDPMSRELVRIKLKQ